jgi:hypothetical protein
MDFIAIAVRQNEGVEVRVVSREYSADPNDPEVGDPL